MEAKIDRLFAILAFIETLGTKTPPHDIEPVPPFGMFMEI